MFYCDPDLSLQMHSKASACPNESSRNTCLSHISNMDFIFSLVLRPGTRRAFRRDFHSVHMQIAVSFYQAKGHFVISSRNHHSVLSRGRWIVWVILIALFILWIWHALSEVDCEWGMKARCYRCALRNDNKVYSDSGRGRTKGKEKGSPNVSS